MITGFKTTKRYRLKKSMDCEEFGEFLGFYRDPKGYFDVLGNLVATYHLKFVEIQNNRPDVQHKVAQIADEIPW